MGKIILNQEEYEKLRNYKTKKYKELEEKQELNLKKIEELKEVIKNDYI